jgi:hypothetical protein
MPTKSATSPRSAALCAIVPGRTVLLIPFAHVVEGSSVVATARRWSRAAAVASAQRWAVREYGERLRVRPVSRP